jgi:hypothetical protein
VTSGNVISPSILVKFAGVMMAALETINLGKCVVNKKTLAGQHA